MATARVVRVRAFGGPEAMELATEDLAPPGPGQAQVRQTAIGVNFADIHYRRGTAPPHAMAKLPIPFTPGTLSELSPTSAR